jgi:V8-like Glu-specific endopeptidase
METTTMMGRTPSDVVEYLKNPLNEELLVNLTKKVEGYWNQ